ncbi:MAG: hypothetical protein MHPSP_002886 [Paramarteilia canceri]
MPTVLINQLAKQNGIMTSDPRITKLMVLMAEYLLGEVIDEAGFMVQKRCNKTNGTLKVEDIHQVLKSFNIPYPQTPSNSF